MTDDREKDPDQAQWARIDSALKKALELGPGEREIWIKSQFQDDPGLLIELQKLLAADRPSRDMMDKAMQGLNQLTDDVLTEEHETQPGQLVGGMIGHYRLTELLATGGMGAVYKAEREDGQFHQTVAIKILPAWATDEKTVARLKAERQILSSLQHPGITRLLDGGETADGFPYLVTEFIDGLPLNLYLEKVRPNLEARLNLFVQIAHAVQSAHETGIVHRDIKPSNVLVDMQGVPHLLDFGIAKLMQASAMDMTMPRTATGFTPMTPEFASPEQRAGGEITESSDVYQLGLLLFQVLTGERGTRHSGLAGVATRPSTVVMSIEDDGNLPDGYDASQMAKSLRGDLDTIVLKALRPDPCDRYTSAADLAQDVVRFLNGEAIQARPETVRSASTRLARHYPVAATLSISLMIILAAFAVSLLIYSQKLEQQRDSATRQAQRAEAARDTLLELYRRTDPLEQDTIGGRSVSVWDSIDATAAQARLNLSNEPDILAELLTTFASLYNHAGQDEKAESTLEEAIALYRTMGSGFEPQLAGALSDLASLISGRDREAAMLPLQEALSLEPGFAVTHPEFAAAVQIDAGHVFHLIGQYQLALPHFRQAGQYLQQLDTLNDSLRIEAIVGQASALINLDRLGEAEALLQEALSLAEEQFGSQHARLNGILSSLAHLERLRNNHAKSVVYAERMVANLEQDNVNTYSSLVNARNNLALAYGRAGLVEQQLELQEEVVTMRREKFGSEGNRDLAVSLKNLASSLHIQGDFARALELLDESQQMMERHLPESSPLLATPHFTRALVFMDDGQPAAAENEARITLAILEPALGQDHYQVHVTRCLLAQALLAQGDWQQASALAPGALEGIKQSSTHNPRYLDRCKEVVQALP